MINKKINWGFDASAPGGIPDGAGDRYYSQDLLRDLLYLMDRIGLLYKDLINQIPFHVSGGAVSQGVGATLNITAGIGYVKKSFQTVLSYSASPPTTQDEDVDAIRINWTQQTNMTPTGYTPGGATNYVKVAYIDLDGATRSRAKKAGTWAYDSSPSYLFSVNTTPPTDYELCLKTFTEAGGVFTFSEYTTHKAGYFNIDTINERRDGNGVTIDGVNVKDSEIYTDKIKEKTAGVGVGLEEVNSAIVRIKIIDIGDWNMDSTASVTIAHGLTANKIRTVSALIRNDDDNLFKFIDCPFNSNLSYQNGRLYFDGTNITLERLNSSAGGEFDSTDYNATSYNRGWITIHYVD